MDIISARWPPLKEITVGQERSTSGGFEREETQQGVTTYLQPKSQKIQHTHTHSMAEEVELGQFGLMGLQDWRQRLLRLAISALAEIESSGGSVVRRGLFL